MLHKIKYLLLLGVVLIMSLLLAGCKDDTPTTPGDTVVVLDMNTDFPINDTLPDGEGKKVKVVLLLGQSNASGASITKYLKENIGEDAFEKYENGYSNVLINYCIDDHNSTSAGEFRKTDVNCGAAEGFFGPELGMAEVLSEAYMDETVIILKYTMSGYSLQYHWLTRGHRGSIYNAFLEFVNTYMTRLAEKNYNAKIGAICWMQGESDTTEFKASRYLDNQTALVSYFREDLQKYSEDGGIYFIDAGISNSPYCEPSYPEINAAKERFSALSIQNFYFSTIDEGYTVNKEPEGEPDWGHYDSLSELSLGRKFGELVVQSYKMRGTD